MSVITDFTGHRALVVDDSTSLRNILKSQLLKLHFQVDEAENGLLALAKLRETHYHILLTDLVMPEMDGFELCEEVRKSSKWRALPVVVVSTYADSHYITRALRQGADDFLVKPVDSGMLINVVNRVTTSLAEEVAF